MAIETPKGSLSDVGFGSILSSLFGGDAGKSPSHARMRPVKRRFGAYYLANLVPAILLCVYGLLVVWSASLTIPEASWPRQMLGVGIGFTGAAFIRRYDYRNLANMTNILLAIDIVLMLMPKVPGLSYSAKGLTGWEQIPLSLIHI